MSAALTKRQLEALLAVYRGHMAHETPDGRYTRNMGGAVHRMVDSLGDRDLLEVKEYASGRRYVRNVLTAAGLRALNTGKIDLPGFDERLAAREALEASMRAEEEAKAVRGREERAALRVAARAERVAFFRETLQSYQLPVDTLTDDQCRAIWSAIVDKEMSLP